MKRKKYKQSEKGFAIALALLMLLVMSLMGATLVMVAGSDHKKNAAKDSNQQAFYAAETGIAQAKKWLEAQSSLSSNSDPNSDLEFCKTSLFSNLSSVQAINNADSGVYVERKRLDEIITVTGDEEDRLEKYTYEFFITNTPDASGDTSVQRKKAVEGSSGSSVAEETAYKSGGTSTGTYYTIFS
ncbi:uncharacterized protein METZ01_LOCUS373184, partial [marine metagenome]